MDSNKLVIKKTLQCTACMDCAVMKIGIEPACCESLDDVTLDNRCT